MTPEDLMEECRSEGFTEFECRQCEVILIYRGRVYTSPLVDDLCDECLARREGQG